MQFMVTISGLFTLTATALGISLIALSSAKVGCFTCILHAHRLKMNRIGKNDLKLRACAACSVTFQIFLCVMVHCSTMKSGSTTQALAKHAEYYRISLCIDLLQARIPQGPLTLQRLQNSASQDIRVPISKWPVIWSIPVFSPLGPDTGITLKGACSQRRVIMDRSIRIST